MTNRQVALICAIVLYYLREATLNEMEEFTDWMYGWLERGKW